mmetsp:Transcript_21613/g.32166  ORF Transcript_21613/g.32166 Transcript_21613/m.32166 type:complete len:261 (+) Transcript_21613:30-812(+)
MITDDGIKVTVEKDKVLQASAYMKKSIFQEYKISGGEEKDREFRVELSVLLDSLNCMDESSSLRLTYRGHGEEIELILENDGQISECSIRTIEGIKALDFNFRSAILLNQASMKSKYLKDSFAELDIPGAQNVELVMSPNSPFMTLKAEGDSVCCKITFPNDELAEVFEHFQCQHYTSYRYNSALIQMCAKSLSRMPKSDTTMIQVNAEGMLKLQHIVRGKDGTTNFISFLIVPEDEIEVEPDHDGDDDDQTEYSMRLST